MKLLSTCHRVQLVDVFPCLHVLCFEGVVHANYYPPESPMQSLQHSMRSGESLLCQNSLDLQKFLFKDRVGWQE